MEFIEPRALVGISRTQQERTRMDAHEEIRELLESLTRESLDDLLKEISETPIPFIDDEPEPKPRRTRGTVKSLRWLSQPCLSQEQRLRYTGIRLRCNCHKHNSEDCTQ